MHDDHHAPQRSDVKEAVTTENRWGLLASGREFCHNVLARWPAQQTSEQAARKMVKKPTRPGGAKRGRIVADFSDGGSDDEPTTYQNESVL